MKLEEAKKLQNMFKIILNKIPIEKCQSKEHKVAIEKIKLLYKSCCR